MSLRHAGSNSFICIEADGVTVRLMELDVITEFDSMFMYQVSHTFVPYSPNVIT